MTAVWYDEDCDCLWIEGAAQAFAARTLRATRDGDMIGVHLKLRSENILWQPYTQITDRAGFGFLSAAEAKTYLDSEFAKLRSAGETFAIPAAAGADLVRGQPVAVSRATGQLLPARADTYALAFVAGLASAATASGFANQPAHGAVTLPDWTNVTGSPALRAGQPYFLAASGGLTPTPRLDTACVSRVGFATGPLTLVVEPSAPILL